MVTRHDMTVIAFGVADALRRAGWRSCRGCPAASVPLRAPIPAGKIPGLYHAVISSNPRPRCWLVRRRRSRWRRSRSSWPPRKNNRGQGRKQRQHQRGEGPLDRRFGASEGACPRGREGSRCPASGWATSRKTEDLFAMRGDEPRNIRVVERDATRPMSSTMSASACFSASSANAGRGARSLERRRGRWRERCLWPQRLRRDVRAHRDAVLVNCVGVREEVRCSALCVARARSLRYQC